MEESSEILAAIKALQTHIGGQIHATNKTLQEFVHSMDSRFVELELWKKKSLHTHSGKFGFRINDSKGETEISSLLRSMKSDVPKFDGTEPQGWILRVEDFFEFHGTPHHMRLQTVHFHMEGMAAVWFQWMQVNNLLTTWPEFIASLQNRFGSSPYNDLQRLHSKLTQISTVAESQTAFENLRDKEGSELKFSELETKVEVEDGLISSIEIGADGSSINEFDCKVGTVTNYVVQIQAIEEEKLKTADAYFANDTSLLYSFADIIPINYMFANEENDGKRISKLIDFPLLLIQELDEKINFVVEQLGLSRPYKAHVARRRTTFKLYALKEVYVEHLNLHLEDKVVLKGRRVDTIMMEDEVLLQTRL